MTKKGSHIMNNNIKPSEKHHVLSIVTLEEEIVEVVFNPDTFEFNFLILTDGEMHQAKSFQDEKRNKEYLPLDCSNVIEKGLLTLPNEPIDYGTIYQLKDEIKAFLNKYVDLPADFLEISTRYVMMSWVFDAFDKIPYLRVVGQYGSGKSRFLSVLASICYHAFDLGAGVTEATIFRTADRYKGTLIIDEGNFGGTGMHSKLAQILNKGYSRSGSIPRCNPRDYEPEYYSVFGPKIIAANSLYSDDALESRFFTCFMMPSERSDIPQYIPQWYEWQEALKFRGKLLKYRMDNYSKIRQTIRTTIPTGLEKFEKRTQEITLPLMYCLDETDAPLQILTFLDKSERDLAAQRLLSIEGEITTKLLEIYDQNRTDIYPKEICTLINSPDVSPKKVASILRKMGLRSSTHTRMGNPFRVTDEVIHRLKTSYHLN
jgi:hypothetical protein